MGAGAAGMQVNPPRQLVGHKVFKRNNPMTDRFPMHKFLHFEFYCQDATNVSKRCVDRADQERANSWGLPVTECS